MIPEETGRSRAVVLVVCTGNVCRSPAAELLLADRLAPLGVEVGSAGTRALVGNAVHEPIAVLLREAGVESVGFSARALAPEQLRRADVVLAMAREHRAAAVDLVPAAVRRTFLLREAAEIAAAIAEAGWPAEAGGPAARLAALPALAPRHRGAAGGTSGEVPDPYGRSAEAYRQAHDLIRSAVDRLAGALTAP